MIITPLVEKITMWKAPDGTIYKTEAEAYRHINKEKAQEALINLIAKEFNWENEFEPGDFASFLLDHAHQIGNLLDEWRGV